MLIKLKNGNINCRAFGLSFDKDGICEADKAIVQSLLDAGAVVETKKPTAKKA